MLRSPGSAPIVWTHPGMCITVDAMEAGLRFPLHPLIEECLRWWRISPSQVAPNSWCYLVVFLGECRGAGIIPIRDLFITCFRLCKSRGGYYLIVRVGFRVSGAPSNNKGWKSHYLFVSGPLCCLGLTGRHIRSAPSTSTAAPAQEVGVSLAREAPKASSKRLINTLTEQVDDPAQRHKKVKVLMRRHKSRHGEGEPHSHSNGKEPTAPSKEPDTPVESDEGGASPVHHRPRFIKDLFKTKVHKNDAGYYILQMSDLEHQDLDKEMKARWRGLKNLTKLEQELGKTKRERDEALQRLEASEKELCEVRSNLAEIQMLLKEARVRARKMDDELLQAVKALENALAELPRQAVDRYKESIGFKEGLKRMGRVTYEYGYRVALSRFHALHPDSEVKEDPFTVHPEDDLVPMERQQAFDDSDPP
ncbi:hypothetical protein GW17_00034421, partial [Ensete ventricosum]